MLNLHNREASRGGHSLLPLCGFSLELHAEILKKNNKKSSRSWALVLKDAWLMAYWDMPLTAPILCHCSYLFVILFISCNFNSFYYKVSLSTKKCATKIKGGLLGYGSISQCGWKSLSWLRIYMLFIFYWATYQQFNTNSWMRLLQMEGLCNEKDRKPLYASQGKVS